MIIDVEKDKQGVWTPRTPEPLRAGNGVAFGNVMNLTLPQLSAMDKLERYQKCRIHCEKPKYEAEVSPLIAVHLGRLFTDGIRPMDSRDAVFCSVKPAVGSESLVIYTRPEQPAVRGETDPRKMTWINASMFAHLDARYDLMR